MARGRRRGSIVVVVPVVLVLLVVVGASIRGGDDTSGALGPGSPTTSAPSTSPSTMSSASSPRATSAVPVDGSPEALLASIAVRSSDPTARYVRDAFGDDWDYDPATGCNTRERVLIEESIIDPVVDDRCRTTVGRWRSAYDGVETSDPADLQVDHFVPLADAWRSGAAAWTDERRRAFANDRTSPDTLIAVTGALNQSKGDATPAEWLPPDETSWCGYAEAWVRVKATWDLSITAAERVRLGELLAAC